MPLTVTDQGRDNRVSIASEAARQFNGAVVLEGSNNVLEVGEGCRWESLSIKLGSGCQVLIGRDGSLGQLRVFARHDARTTIGKRCVINGFVRLLSHEAASLTLGDGCLLAGFVDISVSDMHSIVDVSTGARLNPAREVLVGERVWIGQRTQILKGARIGAGSIIGAGSVVTGEIPPNVIAAGVPARVIREGVTWRSDLI